MALMVAFCAGSSVSAATLRATLGTSAGTCGSGLAPPAEAMQTLDQPGFGAVDVAGSNNTGCSGEAMALAGAGFLSVYSSSLMVPFDPDDPALANSPWRRIDGRTTGTSAFASNLITFVPVATVPGLSTTDPFQISASMLLTGLTSANFNIFRDGAISSPGAVGRLSAILTLGQWLDGGERVSGNFRQLTTKVAEDMSFVGPDDVGAGGTAEQDLSITLTTEPVWVLPGQEIVIEKKLLGSTRIRGSRDTIAGAVGDSQNTLAFSTTDPIFDLPDGYTVNIPEWNIFNNRWIDPRNNADQPDVSAVPLPAGLPIMLLGLSALGFARLRGRIS